jgi:multidrug efflux pump subunit AcrA (membrane-fusion protein)
MSSPTSMAVEQAQRRLRDVLAELRSAAEQPVDDRKYYRLWLTRLVEAIGADAADCRLRKADGGWEIVHRLKRADIGGEAGVGEQRIGEMIAEVCRTLKPAIDAGSTPTCVVFPLLTCGELRGVARLDLAVETEAARQGCLKFVADAAEAVERFHLLADRREARNNAADVDDERRFYSKVHGTVDLAGTAHNLANEGRELIGCDRLSVLVRRGAEYRIAAVSGQEEVNRRAGAARTLESLTAQCAATGETVAFPETGAGLDEELTDALEEYVDESHVKRIVVTSLEPPRPENGDQEEGGGANRAGGAIWDRRPRAALVVEYFGETAPRDDELRRIRLTARCGASAVAAALEHDSIFLLSLWRTLGRWKQACFAPGTRRRTWIILAAVTAAVTALAIVPADMTVFCRGTLNPAVRRRIFAPLDGTVAEIKVKHGDRVKQGQPLVVLRNTDLDIAEAEVVGRRTAAVEQLIAVERALVDEARRSTAEERAKLSGERSQLREQIEALDRQLELYAQKRKLLVVESPIDGEITTWNAEDLLEQRPVRQGQQLLMVADVGGGWELELQVPDDKSGRVVETARTSAEPLKVTFSPALDPGTVREGVVAEVHNSAELRGDEGSTVLVRVQIRAEELPQRRPGAEVAAHVHCGREPIGYVWTCDAVDFVKRRILFRWF